MNVNKNKYDFIQHQEKKEHFLKNKNFKTQFWLFKFFNRKNVGAGFTLIELLIVITIIGLLVAASVVALNNARKRSRDTKRKSDFSELTKAINLYYDKYSYYPPNMSGTTSPYYDNFNNMAQILITNGFLANTPISPCGLTCSYSSGGYAYFNYGPTSLGAMIITYLEDAPNTTTGIPPSSRQSTGSSNFCYSSNSRQYCMIFK